MRERTARRVCRDNQWWSALGKKWAHIRERRGPSVRDDLVKRASIADDANELWPPENTEHWSDEGKVHLCATEDTFPSPALGHSVAYRKNARIVANALDNEISRWRNAASCIVHSGHGSQFRSRKYAHELNRHDLIGSIGQVGAAGDNATMESSFSPLQTTVLDRKRWWAREELRIVIITWIERNYRRRRRQARPDRSTPDGYTTVINHAVDLAAQGLNCRLIVRRSPPPQPQTIS